jgi:hypothetical protein
MVVLVSLDGVWRRGIRVATGIEKNVIRRLWNCVWCGAVMMMITRRADREKAFCWDLSCDVEFDN